MIKLKTKGESNILNKTEVSYLRKFIKKHKGCYISLNKNHTLSIIGKPNNNYTVYQREHYETIC